MGQTSSTQPAGASAPTRELIERIYRSELGAILRRQLHASLEGLGASRQDVEDAFHEACARGLRGQCDRSSQGQVYAWLRETTHNTLVDRLKKERRDELVDWGPAQLEAATRGDSPAADTELLKREMERELGELVRTALAQLTERQRKVVALQSQGARGAEIASRLGTSERTVKRLKEQSLASARGALAVAAGSGCGQGEELIRRLAFGLATSREQKRAQLHLACCEHCGAVYQRLELWREKIAALLPLPASEQIDPGLVERTLHKTVDTVAGLKQQLADAGGQAKQHAATAYFRAVDPTPLAGARPGAAAAVISGCIALGGGGGYCLEQGVSPVAALGGIVSSAPEQRPEPRPEPQPPASQPPDPAQVPAAPPAAPEPEAQQPAASAPRPEPPPAPPPEPTPAAVQFGEPASPPASSSTQQPSPAPAEFDPAPVDGGTDLYGP